MPSDDKSHLPAELVKRIHAESRSISFDSMILAFETAFPDAALRWHERILPLDLIEASEKSLEKGKFDLVAKLFKDAESFARTNREHYHYHPLSVLHLSPGSHAVLDGHHRFRRLADLVGRNAPVSCVVVTTRSIEFLDNFRRQVRSVKEANGSAHVADLPIV